MKGLVIKSTGTSYGVYFEDGTTADCHVKGNFRIRGIRSTNPIAIGDYVEVTTLDDGTHWITELYDRKNYIVRRSTNLSYASHILAANVDMAALIVTLRHPETSTTFIDRFLATCEAYRVPACLIFNKVDLLNEEEQ
jgi:ribosome biogenesis GTPase